MYHNENYTTTFFLDFNKSIIKSKFYISNYFFLTNNSLMLSNYRSFLFLNNCTIKINNITPNLISKKNNFYFNRILNRYRNYIFFGKYIFKKKFKFNKFFKFIGLSKIINNDFNYKIKLITNLKSFKPSFFSKYSRNFLRNWNFIIGSLLSPFYWDLFSKKKWIRKNISLIYTKNYLYFKNNSKNNSKNNLQKNFKKNRFFFNKKMFINNFFYFYKNKIDYSRLHYLIKISSTSLFNIKKNSDWFFSRPYLFFNNYENVKNSRNYPNSLLINIYKSYLRFFSLMKRLRFNYKHRKSNDFFFKNILFNTDVLSKSYGNRHGRIYRSLRDKSPSFLFTSIFVSIKKDHSTFHKKILKKYKKIERVLGNRRIFKILKKNKFFFNCKFLRNLDFNKNMRSTKFSRRIKKSHIFLKSFNFFKNPIKNNFQWVKKNFTAQPSSLKFNKFNFFWNNKTFNKFNKFNFFWNNKTFNKFNFKNNSLIKKFSYFTNNFKSSFIFSRLKKPIYITREKNNFSLKQYGFIFINNVFLTFSNKLNFFYNLKKNIYSFSYKNEIQRYILKKYIKNNLINTNIVNNFLRNNSQKQWIYSNFNQNTTDLSTVDNFFKKKNETFFLINKGLSSFKTWNYFNTQLAYSKNNFRNESEFVIKRVRFKPGYMNLWRNVRNVLKNSLFLNIKYQYRLTNYLSKYKKFIKFKTFLVLEMRLVNILIRSRLFNDSSLCTLFLKNNLIFLNGAICSNPNIQIFIGDFIQLIVNIKYYLLHKWFLNLALKKKNKLKRVARKKNNPSFDPEEKKRSNSLPKWMLSSKNAIDDVANFIEVDYFTLSVFILYEPFLWSDLNSYNLIDQKFGIINLYNWKYIT